MKKSRDDIEQELILTIRDIHVKGKAPVVKEIMIKDLEKYFLSQKIIQIVNENIPINTLNDYQLYLIANHLVERGYMDINLSDYYHDEEITKAVNSVRKEVNYNGVLEFKDVLRIKGIFGEQFITVASYQEIGQMKEAGILNYNYETQRKAKIIKRRGIHQRVATINKQNVEAIKQAVLEGRFEANTITLNIRKDCGYNYVYSETTKTLIIYLDETQIDTIDGEHREQGIHAAWIQDPMIEGYMIISIKNLTVEDARYFIAQEAKGTLNNQDEMILYDSTSNVAALVKDINRYSNPNNILYNKISQGIRNENVLVYYEIFSKNMLEAWGDVLITANQREMLMIRDFICKFYSIVYDGIMNKFNVSDIEDLNDTIALDHMFISGFLYPACAMYKNNKEIGMDQIEQIDKMISKLDFRKNEGNPYVYDDGCTAYTFNKYKAKWMGSLK